MNDELPITKLLNPSALDIFGLTNETLKFRGLDYWNWFSIVVNENNTGKRILDGTTRFEYFKCYVISVAKMINKKYKEPENKAGYGFQSEFLNEVTIKVQRFYEDDPQKHFFYKFIQAPVTVGEEKSIENWLIRTSEQRVINYHNKWFKEVYKTQGIDYDAFRFTLRDYKKIKKDFDNKIIKDEPIKPVLEDFRDPNAVSSSSINATDTTQYTESSFHNDIREFEDIEEYLIPNDSYQDLIDETVKMDSLVSRFDLANEKKMRELFDRFDPNDISEIDIKGIWEVNYVYIDTDKLWSIFTALDQGEILTAEGKQFLLLQYTTIALAIIKNKLNIDIHQGSDFKGTAILSTKQMQLLATTLGQSFVEINKNYKTLILDQFEKRTNYKSQSWKERLFSILHNAIEKKLDTQFKIYLKPKPKKSLLGLKDNSIPHVDEIEIQKQFKDIESFERFLSLIQDYFDGKLDVEELLKISSLKAHLSDTKVQLDTIFTYFNPQSQIEKQDYNYITKGAVSAVITNMMSCYKMNGEKLNITLTNDENSLNTETITKIVADFLKNVIAKDYNINRADVSELAKEVIYKDLAEMDIPLSVSIPEGAEYDSYRTMVEINGSLSLQIPFATQGENPFWENQVVLDDMMVKMVDKSITDMIRKIDISKEIFKHL